MARSWKNIDLITVSSIPYLIPDDECIYANDYISKTGFHGGQVNDCIINFKKPPGAPGQQHRTRAINKIALDASELFDCESGRTYAVTAMPSSKSKSDPSYDNRFEDLFQLLKTFSPCINIIWPVTAKNSVMPSHQNGPRDPKVLKNNYNFNGFAGSEPEFLIVFDDVLTSGAHFRAYKDFITQSGYQGKVFGVFWAKTK